MWAEASSVALSIPLASEKLQFSSTQQNSFSIFLIINKAGTCVHSFTLSALGSSSKYCFECCQRHKLYSRKRRIPCLSRQKFFFFIKYLFSFNNFSNTNIDLWPQRIFLLRAHFPFGFESVHSCFAFLKRKHEL